MRVLNFIWKSEMKIIKMIPIYEGEYTGTFLGFFHTTSSKACNFECGHCSNILGWCEYGEGDQIWPFKCFKCGGLSYRPDIPPPKDIKPRCVKTIEKIYVVRAKVSYEVINVSGTHENLVAVAKTEEQAMGLVRELINVANTSPSNCDDPSQLPALDGPTPHRQAIDHAPGDKPRPRSRRR